jgi:hypothetical protein
LACSTQPATIVSVGTRRTSFFGELDVAQDPVRHPVETVTDGDGEDREGLLVAVLGLDHEIDVHVYPIWRHLEGTLAKYGAHPAPSDSILVPSSPRDRVRFTW